MRMVAQVDEYEGCNTLKLDKADRKELYKQLKVAYKKALTDYGVYLFAKCNITVGSVLPKQFQIHMPVVYREYKRWCSDTGTNHVSPQRFAYHMLETGARTERRSTFGRKYYTNVTLSFSPQGDRRFSVVKAFNATKATYGALRNVRASFIETIRKHNDIYNNFILYYKVATDTERLALSAARIMRKIYKMLHIACEKDPIFCYVPNIYGEDIIKKR